MLKRAKRLQSHHDVYLTTLLFPLLVNTSSFLCLLKLRAISLHAAFSSSCLHWQSLRILSMLRTLPAVLRLCQWFCSIKYITFDSVSIDNCFSESLEQPSMLSQGARSSKLSSLRPSVRSLLYGSHGELRSRLPKPLHQTLLLTLTFGSAVSASIIAVYRHSNLWTSMQESRKSGILNVVSIIVLSLYAAWTHFTAI